MSVRKSTPKYQIETQEGIVVFGPASKTDCKRLCAKFNRKGKPDYVRVTKVN